MIVIKFINGHWNCHVKGLFLDRDKDLKTILNRLSNFNVELLK
jgi:hypothetical protein